MNYVFSMGCGGEEGDKKIVQMFLELVCPEYSIAMIIFRKGRECRKNTFIFIFAGMTHFKF